jgi:hypothetical protein
MRYGMSPREVFRIINLSPPPTWSGRADLPMDDLPMDDLPMDDLPMDDLPMDDLPMDDLPMDVLPMVGDRPISPPKPCAPKPPFSKSHLARRSRAQRPENNDENKTAPSLVLPAAALNGVVYEYEAEQRPTLHGRLLLPKRGKIVRGIPTRALGLCKREIGGVGPWEICPRRRERDLQVCYPSDRHHPNWQCH